MKRIVATFLTLGLMLSFATSPVRADESSSRKLLFDVFLDGKKIGYHLFEIRDDAEGPAVYSEASFDVKFLFVTAFRYRHNTNGTRLSVVGARTTDGFVIDTGDGEAELPECVMTFAYWNPGFLEQPQLLNPQTGEYLAVEVEELGTEAVQISGEEMIARSVRITAPKVDIKLWYSKDAEWLALESVAKGGRIIRYELA